MGFGELLGIRLTRRIGVVRRMGAQGVRDSTAELRTMMRRDVGERRMGVQRGSIGWKVEYRVVVDVLSSCKFEKERKRGWE